MKPLFIVKFGEPMAQERPRARVVNNGKPIATIYDPSKSKKYKDELKEITRKCIAAQGWECFEEPLDIVVTAYFGYKKSWTKKFTQEVKTGKVQHTSKPDTDNILKIIMDGCSPAYKDDSQIVSATCHKYYSENPQVVISIYKHGDDHV